MISRLHYLCAILLACIFIGAMGWFSDASAALDGLYIYKQWDLRYGGFREDILFDGCVADDGGYFLLGSSMSDAGGEKSEDCRGWEWAPHGDYWVVRIDASGAKLWDRTCGGSNDDDPYCVLCTPDGGCLLGGYSDSSDGDKSEPCIGLEDFWIVKLDADGNRQWDRTIGGESGDALAYMALAHDGGYVLAGSSASGVGGDKTEPLRGECDYWIVKVDTNGVREWDRTFGGIEADMLRDIQRTSDGGYILLGQSSSGIGGDKTEACRGLLDCWVIKLDGAGVKEWDKTFGGSQDEWYGGIKESTNGGYILYVCSTSGADGDKTSVCRGGFDYWVVKIAKNGVKQWDLTMGGTSEDLITHRSLGRLYDGSWILCGSSASPVGWEKSEPAWPPPEPYRDERDFWTVCFDDSGTFLWDKRFGGTLDDLPAFAVGTADGGFLLAGASYSQASGDKSQDAREWAYEYWVLKAGFASCSSTLVHYVWTNSPAPTFPHASWETAAHEIQTAVDCADPGDTVLVTNGVYDVGGRIADGGWITNRVVVTSDITVASVNGKEFTSIRGNTGQATGSMRCVFMGAGVLDGFTIQNGRANETNDFNGGGILAAGGSVIYRCAIESCVASGDGGGAYGGILRNCVVKDNRAYGGGGVACSTVEGSAIWKNRSVDGGGAYLCGLQNCNVVLNEAAYNGGGIAFCSARQSIVYHNTSLCLHGVANAYDSSGSNSCVTPDVAWIYNITNEPGLLSPAHIMLDSPCVAQGGNEAPPGVDIDGDVYLVPSCLGCDQVLAGSMTGKLDVAIFADHAGPVAVGSELFMVAEIRGRPVGNLWSFGDGGGAVSNRAFVSHAWTSTGLYEVVLLAFNEEFQGGVSATVKVNVVSLDASTRYVWQDSPEPTWPYDSWSNAAHTIQEAVDAQQTSGGLVLVTNGVYDTGAFTVPDLGSFQRNRLIIAKDIVVESVNGPEVTLIVGEGPYGPECVRCVHIEAGALCGFTLTNGFTYSSTPGQMDPYGGGAYAVGGRLVNCVVTGCRGIESGGAVWGGWMERCRLENNWSGMWGGGACRSTLIGCVVSGNTAGSDGGGLAFSVAHNSLIVGNEAWSVGGVLGSTLVNCTVVSNSIRSIYQNGAVRECGLNNVIVWCNVGEPNVMECTSSNSCAPELAEVHGNITNAPFFADTAAGDYRLRYDSPCIDTGAEAVQLHLADLDGVARPVDGNYDGVALPDMGAYEYKPSGQDADADMMPDAWEFRYGLEPADSGDAGEDGDGDGVANASEFIADTDPTNPASLFRVDGLSGLSEFNVWFDSSSNRVYSLERRGSMVTGEWSCVEGLSNIVGRGASDHIVDTNLYDSSFYRLRVRVP